MNTHPNYRDFYQKSCICMGESDRSKFVEQIQDQVDHTNMATHWLIALEGEPIDNNSEIYIWKVIVFPAYVDGMFHYQNPQVLIKSIHSIHKAVELAKELETHIKSDCLLINYSNKQVG
ncbi:hypothetical protein [Cytobacillus sp. IB215665]|uniref:hypothetical protein n=1 Tax=Cytobacillus sp. IB215665 TaxID=3097357 RepID=UPI002A138DD2|nr:hypothetical protein [Cytobacillus sp. IB215665]MDX8365753.1 hypothetical protein [Cytobacillus sp. IB215665]